MALLENGADINVVDKIGGSAALTLAAWQGRDHLVELLLEQGADPDRRERNGRTAFHIAAERGYQDCVILLVEGGADIDAVIHGWTPMLLACQLPSHSYIPTYLVNKGAKVRVANHNGRTALHWAAQHGRRGFASLLLGKGADVDARDQWGKTPRQYAMEQREQAVLILFEAFIAHQTM
jgi:ankyrin repeat protein